MTSDSQVQGMDDAATLWDLYCEIQEAIREALFGSTTFPGQSDAADAGAHPDADALRRLLDEWRRVRSALDGHHGHERDVGEPPARHRSLPAQLETARRRTDAVIERLHRLAASLEEPDCATPKCAAPEGATPEGSCAGASSIGATASNAMPARSTTEGDDRAR